MDNSMTKSVQDLIYEKYDEMTPLQCKIADFVLNNPDFVIKNSITSLSEEVGVKSEASVVRFYRFLGFDGFVDFKIHIAQNLVGQQVFYRSAEDICINDHVEEIKRKSFSGAIASINTCMKINDTEIYDRAADLILSASRIILTGYGSSGSLASYAHFRFLELGLNVHFSTDSHVNSAILSSPAEGDLIFCISRSGETTDILKPLESIKGKEGLSIVSITNRSSSTLAQWSDAVLCANNDGTSQMTESMNTRLLQLLIIDTLFSVISIKKGKDAFNHLRKIRSIFTYKKGI